MSRRRLEFELGAAVVEAVKLKKFNDADESQIQWLPDADRFTLLDQLQYTILKDYTKDRRELLCGCLFFRRSR